MTKATREATVEEYLALAESGDHEGFITFVHECFGTDEDFDAEGADTFALKALPLLNDKVKEAMENVTEATPEMMEAEATGQVVETPVVEEPKADDAQVEAATAEATEEK